MKKIIAFIEAFKLARVIIKKRTRAFDDLENVDGWKREAISEYRTMWPKTPYTCCDDAHEAGFVHGYYAGKSNN